MRFILPLFLLFFCAVSYGQNDLNIDNKKPVFYVLSSLKTSFTFEENIQIEKSAERLRGHLSLYLANLKVLDPRNDQHRSVFNNEYISLTRSSQRLSTFIEDQTNLLDMYGIKRGKISNLVGIQKSIAKVSQLLEPIKLKDDVTDSRLIGRLQDLTSEINQEVSFLSNNLIAEVRRRKQKKYMDKSNGENTSGGKLVQKTKKVLEPYSQWIDLKILHEVKQEQVFQVLRDPRAASVIWVGHGVTKNSSPIGSETFLKSYDGVNISSLFSSLPENLLFLGIVGCEANPLLEKYSSEGFYDKNRQLTISASSDKVRLKKNYNKVLNKAVRDLAEKGVIPWVSRMWGYDFSKFVGFETHKNSSNGDSVGLCLRVKRGGIHESPSIASTYRLELHNKTVALLPPEKMSDIFFIDRHYFTSDMAPFISIFRYGSQSNLEKTLLAFENLEVSVLQSDHFKWELMKGPTGELLGIDQQVASPTGILGPELFIKKNDCLLSVD